MKATLDVAFEMANVGGLNILFIEQRHSIDSSVCGVRVPIVCSSGAEEDRIP